MKYNNLTDLVKGLGSTRPNEQFVSEISTGRILTYWEFYQMVQVRASYLRQCGVNVHDKVGLMYKNSIEFMVDFFAILENQAIVVPINPSLKKGELKYIFQDANIKYIIVECSEVESIYLFADSINKWKINNETSIIEIDDHMTEDTRPDNLIEGTAIILYTSGSTGKAKGVMLTHCNLLNEVQNIKLAHALMVKDKVLCILPWFHINGLVITMLTPLFVGHEMVIAEKFSQSHFWQWIDDYQITWFSGVPTIYVYLLAGSDYNEHNSLRFARSASSSLPVKVLREFEERYHVPVIESYGMTEGGSQLTSNPIPPKIRKAGSVGLPYGLEVRVVNDESQVCCEDEVGEVQFRGKSISDGYYKKKEETDCAFDEGWLKTGDVGYLDVDGYLFLVGRKKELINRSGEKFSPKEIDELLYQYKGIKMAAAVGVPDEVRGEEVVAFCVPNEGVELSADEIVMFCRKNLADFKVPKEIIFVDELPVGGNGKVQRLKLTEKYEEMKML